MPEAVHMKCLAFLLLFRQSAACSVEPGAHQLDGAQKAGHIRHSPAEHAHGKNAPLPELLCATLSLHLLILTQYLPRLNLSS